MGDPLTKLQTALEDRYRVERELGAGGMATVYLAEDVKHERKVALKVLRPELTAVLGTERFLNEIRVTAHLQHPHILQLYDSGAAEGLLYYVMPYVEGESLRDRLSRERQLPVDEAVEITRAVAGALDYAHRHGVVHRDIKPENILLHEGQPLVADFGIALAVSAAGGSRLTETGLSLGTPHYMSPEQATGDRALDGRSDIYSLGCVAYEMLAGNPPHTGPTAQAIIAKIVTEAAPRLSVARPSVPPHVEAAIHTAIEKLHADRFHTAAEFADALARPLTAAQIAATAARAAGAPAAAPQRSARRTEWRVAAALALATFGAGVLIGRAARPTVMAGALTRFVVDPEPAIMATNAFGPQLAISPDGRLLAFAGRGPRGTQIFVRAMADSTPRPVSGTDNGVAPFFSPDGRWLGFWVANRLMKVPVEGGVPTEIADSADYYAAWADDGSIVFLSLSQQALRVLTPGGVRRDVVRSDSARFLGLSLLPGGRTALTALQVGRGGSPTTTVAVSLTDGTIRPIGLADALTAKYVPSGYLVYQRRLGGPLYAAPFDRRRLRVAGTGRPIAPGARVTFRVFPQWDVAGGVVAYLAPEPLQLALADRRGGMTVLREEPRSYHHPRFSPDGRRVAVDFIEGGERDVWVFDLADRTLTRLTVGEFANDPFWSPDGRRIAYTSVRGAIRGIFVRNADGSGAPDSVLTDQHDRSSGAWLADGSTIVSSTGGLAGLWLVHLVQPRRAEPIAGSRPGEAFPAVSPDGRWLAYVSDESGKREVYVRPLPGPGGRRQVSTDGGSEPAWARSGRELFYREDTGGSSRLIAVAVRTAPTFDVLSRAPLFDVTTSDPAEDHANYDVSPDGSRFVMVRSPRSSPIHLIQNWPALLTEGGARGN